MKRRPFLVTPALAALPRTAAPAASGQRTLHLPFNSPETVLDPVQTNSDANTSQLLANILEAPLTFDYLARPVKLALATAAAMPEVSSDGRVFTLRITPGIFFADDPAFAGKPRELVAEDYVYAIKRFYDPKYNSSDLYLFESLKLPGLSELRRKALEAKKPFDYDTAVEGARALDRWTLRITLGLSDPRFIYLLAMPQYTGAVAREVVEFYGEAIGEHPVGTGAFKLESWRRGSRIELERNPGFREVIYEGTPAADPIAQRVAAAIKGRRLPLADRVVIDVVEEEQPRWLSFLNGSYHWLQVPGSFRGLAAPAGQLAPYLAKRGVRLHKQLVPD